MINDLWTDIDNFQTREGGYKERDYIFTNHVDTEKRPYLWHKKNSLAYTNILGEFACRVCSKILGIGSAERSWGDVKTLKNGKRSHLSSEHVKKQATIFGASCIEMAKYQRGFESSSDVSSSPLKFWRDDDFGVIGKKDGDEKMETKPKRVFRAYIEDWEEQATKKRDVVNKARLLKKYGGLSWCDPDTGNKLLYADRERIHWTKVTRNGGGYSVHARGSNYVPCENEEDAVDTEPWFINEDLIECIAEYYTINSGLGVLVETKNNED